MTGDYNNPPFVVNGTATTAGKCTLMPGYISDIVASDVVEQVNTHAADQTPWYMAMHFTAPHAPYTGVKSQAIKKSHDRTFFSETDACDDMTALA